MILGGVDSWFTDVLIPSRTLEGGKRINSGIKDLDWERFTNGRSGIMRPIVQRRDLSEKIAEVPASPVHSRRDKKAP